jgi:hypothetical protein
VKHWGFVMAMHNTNSLLKYVLPPVLIVLFIVLVSPLFHKSNDPVSSEVVKEQAPIQDSADHDSAAESLKTLTAELSGTKQQITEVNKTNEDLKKQNDEMLKKLDSKQGEMQSDFTTQIQTIKEEISSLTASKENQYPLEGSVGSKAITTVTDLSQPAGIDALNLAKTMTGADSEKSDQEKRADETPIPYYTIPANGTSVKDKLMTALVGRIPVKGVVTDPYPFKIVISDDNLAANGLRVPHLLQMIVSGYCEGDLNLLSVRGWITSLTFVFDDGTISSTTSNDNDIGNFTKANSLGYLSDEYGNPFIRGKLITNAPTYLGGNVALGMATGAATAYAQNQTTTNSSVLGGTSTSSVTGSAGKYVVGQSMASGMNEASDWWHDRQQQSFDAIYVPTSDDQNQSINIAVNFAKEIHIDYDKHGRKLSYANNTEADNHHNLD